MSRPSLLDWVVCVTTNRLPSQSQTLALLVATAIRLERPNLAQIGRHMAAPITAKTATQRAWRFTCNDRIEVADAMAGVIRRLARQGTKRLLISLDWVEVRDFPTRRAAAWIGGRAVPLIWASYPQWKLARSQNSLEEGLVRLLRTLLPPGARVLILADRGFGRAGPPEGWGPRCARSWASTTSCASGPTSRCRPRGIGARGGSTPCTKASPTCCGTSTTARTGA